MVLEIDDIHLRHCMLFEFNKKSKAAQAKRNICSVYGDILTESTCQRWFSKFRAGNFDLEDKPRSGRPSFGIDGSALLKMVEADSRLSTQKMAEKLNSSKRVVNAKLKKLGFVYHENEWIYKGKSNELDITDSEDAL